MRILKNLLLALSLAAVAAPVFGQADTTIFFDPATGEVGEKALGFTGRWDRSHFLTGPDLSLSWRTNIYVTALTSPGTVSFLNDATADTNDSHWILLRVVGDFDLSVPGVVWEGGGTQPTRAGANTVYEFVFEAGQTNASLFPALLPQAQVEELEADQAAQDTAIAGKADAVHTHAAADINSGTLDPARLAGGTATAGYVPKSNGDGTATWAPDANDGIGGGSAGILATGSTTDDTLTSLWSYTIPLNSSVSVEAWLTGGGSANDVMLKQRGHFVRRDASASLRGTNDVEIIPSDTTMVGGWKLEGDDLHYYVTGTNEPMNWTATITTNLVQNAEGAGYLLEDLSVAAYGAYSLNRQLSADYAGNAYEVRRASDDTTLAIGFLGGVADHASAISFCAGTDGFVTIVYDQSGNGRNLSAVAGAQPKIITAGAMEVDAEGFGVAVFDGADDYLSAGVIAPGANFTYFIKFSNTSFVNGDVVVNGGIPTRTALRQEPAGLSINSGTSQAIGSYGVGVSLIARIAFDSGDVESVSVNDSADSTPEAGANEATAFAIGESGDTRTASIEFSEAILFDAKLTESVNAADDQAVFDDMNEFYLVYP